MGTRGWWLQPFQEGWQEGRHCGVAHGETQQMPHPSFPLGMAWLSLPFMTQTLSVARRGKAQASFGSFLQAPSGDGGLSAREGTVLGRTEAQEILSSGD